MALTCNDCLAGNPWKCKDKSCANYNGSGFSSTRKITNRPAIHSRLYKKGTPARKAGVRPSIQRKLNSRLRKAVDEARAEGRSEKWIAQHLSGKQLDEGLDGSLADWS